MSAGPRPISTPILVLPGHEFLTRCAISAPAEYWHRTRGEIDQDQVPPRRATQLLLSGSGACDGEAPQRRRRRSRMTALPSSSIGFEMNDPARADSDSVAHGSLFAPPRPSCPQDPGRYLRPSFSCQATNSSFHPLFRPRLNIGTGRGIGG